MAVVKQSGVYAIRNSTNGKCYFGSTIDWPRRRTRHRYELRRGVHHCEHLQRAWNKYGESAFEFTFIQAVEPSGLVCAEQKLFDENPDRYNRGTSAALPWLGKKHTAASRCKMRERQLGKKHSEETKEKVRQANIGRKLTDEHKGKVSAGLKGIVRSPEVARKNRGVGYWWVPRIERWQGRVYHNKTKVCDVYRDTEDEVKEVVLAVRSQVDAGLPVCIPPPRGKPRRNTRKGCGKGYYFCSQRNKFRVDYAGKCVGRYQTEDEAVAKVTSLREVEVCHRR